MQNRWVCISCKAEFGEREGGGLVGNRVLSCVWGITFPVDELAKVRD